MGEAEREIAPKTCFTNSIMHTFDLCYIVRWLFSSDLRINRRLDFVLDTLRASLCLLLMAAC